LLVSLIALPTAASGAVTALGGDLAAAARVLERGEELRLVGVAAEGGERTLRLTRLEVVAPDARLEIHEADGVRVAAFPRTVYLAGSVEGVAGSRAVVAVRESGEVRMVVAEPDGWSTARALSGAEPILHRATPAGSPAAAPASAPASAHGDGFACAADGLAAPDIAEETPGPALFAAAESATAGGVEHSARVAIETDWEYRQKFPSATAASEYAVDLLAFSSTIYTAEVATSLVVQSVSIWNSSGDPWAQGASSPACGFFEFGKYWNDNRAGVSRTIAHFLSGKNNGGGIAWIGVLCAGAFTQNISSYGCSGMTADSNYGGGYGYTGSIDGDFDPGDPGPVWDIIAVSHEIGHNFGSPHTHCYANYGGSSAHVDQCWTSSSSGCYAPGGTKTLPGIASVTGGSPGQGNGTIMSYCHQLTGGYDNIGLTFGLDHPYGVDADRVPQRMAAHVASRASSDPSCLAVVAGSLLTDDFESGGFGKWILGSS
jgi:hypothetical protein